MKYVKHYLSVALVAGMMTSASSAPLFPDVPDQHWAKDAVAALAAKGLVEGYPDGTFKGDRAASRWETAMIVARLLAKMEQAHQTFATRSELESLRRLTDSLSEELEALGVRVISLEEGVARIDRRVTELERITFYGFVDARMTMQSFSNQGVGDNDNLRNGSGVASHVPFLNYDNAVGSNLGATRRPQFNGVFPVVDYRLGRALTNGTGFTARALLGLNVVVSPDVDAGVEFSAFSSQGDQVVDAYWGVSAPWLSNIFTSNQIGATGQGVQHTPYTRMNLDRFWVHHKPSKTKVTVGQIDKTRMDPLVFAGQVNLGVYGPGRWAGYGVDITGEFAAGDDARVEWELFRTQFGDGNVFQGQNYQNYNLGGNLAYHFNNEAGKVQFNFVRTAEEAASGGLTLVGGLGPGGGTTGINVAYGASQGWSVRQWVNPPGYFANQFNSFHQLNAGQLTGGQLVLNTVDNRPISGWNGALDNATGFASAGGGGNFGPQSQNIYGLSARHRWPLREGEKAASLSLAGEWAHSVYKPSRNSSYNSEGDAFHIELESTLLEERLTLGAEYLSVDANYAPAAWFGNSLGVRFPRSMNFTGVWHLHNFAKYPHNREGVRLSGNFKFNENHGTVWAKARFLEQKQTSLYDVRVLAGGLGTGTPSFPVLGFRPGFIDPIFSGFAHPSLYGAASANSFTNALTPLENPRGSEDGFDVGFAYRWDDPKLKFSGSYGHSNLLRESSLSPLFGGDQNHVDLDIDTLNLEIQWDASQKMTLTGGVDYTRSQGHLDPAGLYHAYAVANNSNSFDNLDSEQIAPYVAVDYQLSEKTELSLSLRHYDTNDGVESTVRAGSGLASVGATAHPFDWSGWQVGSQISMKF